MKLDRIVDLDRYCLADKAFQAECRATILDQCCLAPPKKKPWGGSLTHCKDPEGDVLTLVG